jgi:DNA-binding transcriptional LysR family regulator
MMNLHALRIFVEVASTGSVTAAADALSISQPAVTAQVRKLEHELGISLITPLGRGITLTHEGRFLFEKAERIFDWEKEMEEQLAQIKAGSIGKLRIASTLLPAHYLLPQWLASYKQQYEQVEVEMRSGNSQQSIERLLHYQADLAIIINESWDERPIRRHHLTDVSYWFIVPPGHPFAGQEVTLKELVQEPFLFREQGSSTRELLFSLCREHGVQPPRVGLQYNGGLVESIQSVRAGYGTMLAPELAVRELVEYGEVGRVFLPGIEIKRPVYLCLRDDDHTLLPAVTRFLEKLV